MFQTLDVNLGTPKRLQFSQESWAGNYACTVYTNAIKNHKTLNEGLD